MKNMERVIFGSILLIGLGFSLQTQACTTDKWLGGTSGIPGNGEAGSPTAISRYSVFCALAITGTSYVQSNAASHTRYIGRFYVYPNVSGSGEVDLLVAYADQGGASALFTISYDGTDFIFDAGGAGGGSGNTPASSGWNLIEFEYDSDGSTFNYWVNEDWDFNALSYAAPTGSFASGSGTVDSVRLGAPNGMGGLAGTITFDAYEAHSKTNVGALLAGDAKGDDTINIFDIVFMRNEILANGLASGQPDCTLDGKVNIFDIVCARNIILGN
jgi:hypothetical protein